LKKTSRAYPVRYDSLGIQIYGDGNVDVKSMKVWSMKSAYGEGTVVPVKAHTQDTKIKTGNIENAGFETGDLTGWTVRGNAFSNEMVTKATDVDGQYLIRHREVMDQQDIIYGDLKIQQKVV